jgi:hypothetical protein
VIHSDRVPSRHSIISPPDLKRASISMVICLIWLSQRMSYAFDISSFSKRDSFFPHDSRRAVIVLHGPHVDMAAEVCPSRDRCLQAARTILDSVHSLSATTFDPVLLPRTVTQVWEYATVVLSLFYSTALVDEREEDAAMFRSEVEVFMYV